jgi:hypothetical protein
MGPFKGSRRKSAARYADMLFTLAFAVHQEFLFYHEKDPEHSDMEVTSDSDTPSVHIVLKSNLTFPDQSLDFVPTHTLSLATDFSEIILSNKHTRCS